jgi:drug/metabolite transporter superfamily protein YnfA
MTTVVEPSLTCRLAPEGSDRSFGLVFAAVFAIIGCWPLLHLEEPSWWGIGIAVALAAIALLGSQILRPFNRAWLAFGRLLHLVMSPMVMGAIFFLCVTPIAYIMRLRGKDILSLSRRPDLASYWVLRPPSQSASETMKRQF